jgi:hypothetical protein
MNVRGVTFAPFFQVTCEHAPIVYDKDLKTQLHCGAFPNYILILPLPRSHVGGQVLYQLHSFTYNLAQSFAEVQFLP